jgi:hypothetical protein
MSELIHDKAFKEVLKGLIGQPFTDSLVTKYLQDSVVEGQLLFKSGEKKESIAEYYAASKDNSWKTVVDALLKSSEFKDSLYKKSYERLKAISDGDTTWGDLFTEIYSDEQYLNEIFVRLVEEEEKVAVTSAKQLQELTGITEIYGYWDEEKEETVAYNGDKKPTKKEAQEEAYKQIEGTFISAMGYRYSKALEDILKAGGKYKDLLQVKPAYFNLPETWSGGLTTNKESSTLWAIVFTFSIDEPNTSVRPDLKAIAREIEAPYSVLMEAHKICNEWKLRS